MMHRHKTNIGSCSLVHVAQLATCALVLVGFTHNARSCRSIPAFGSLEVGRVLLYIFRLIGVIRCDFSSTAFQTSKTFPANKLEFDDVIGVSAP